MRARSSPMFLDEIVKRSTSRISGAIARSQRITLGPRHGKQDVSQRQSQMRLRVLSELRQSRLWLPVQELAAEFLFQGANRIGQ